MKVVLVDRCLYQLLRKFMCKKDNQEWAELESLVGQRRFVNEYTEKFMLPDVKLSEIFVGLKVNTANGRNPGKVVGVEGERVTINWSSGNTVTGHYTAFDITKVEGW